MSTAEPEFELLTPTQAADYLAVGERMIRRLIFERRVAVVKVGRHVRLLKADLDNYIEQNRQVPAPWRN